MKAIKTEETERLERSIRSATHKMGVYGCFEVTIGFSGSERVDYITYDTKGIWRCYEMLKEAYLLEEQRKNREEDLFNITIPEKNMN